MANALYGFAYTEKALAFLESLGMKIRRQIISKIKTLASNPIPPNSKLVRGMKAGDEQVRRIRSGDYRVLYTLRANPQHVVVIDIGHRKDVYR